MTSQKKKKKKYVYEIEEYYGCLGLIFSIVYSKNKRLFKIKYDILSVCCLIT